MREISERFAENEVLRASGSSFASLDQSNIEDINVSFFMNCKSSDPHDLSLLGICKSIISGDAENPIQQIRALVEKGDYESANKLKIDQLPAFTPSGLFQNGRKKDNLFHYSSFVVLDIDNLDPERFQETFDKIEACPYTFFAFRSPKGNGIKILVGTDSSDSKNHETAYKQVSEYYRSELEVKIDGSGKDVTRLCIVSSDKSGYLNKEAKKFKVNFNQSTTEDHKFSKDYGFALKNTKSKRAYEEGERNNFIHFLACECNRFGVDQNWAVSRILKDYGYDDLEAIKKSINSAYNNKEENGIYKGGRAVPNSTYSSVSFNKNVSISIPLGELLDRIKDEPPRKFVYPGMHENGFGLVYGLAKTGKTVFCENFGMSIAAGREEFLGKPINIDNRKVLFMSLEENYTGRGERNKVQLGAFNESERESILKNYYVVNEHVPRIIETDADWQIITRQIEEVKPGIVFLDSLTRVVSDIENLESAKPAMLRLRQMAEDYKVTVVVIHHSIKIDYAQPMTIQNLAGSRVVSQESDFVIGINKSITNQRYIKLLFTRYDRDDQEKVDLFHFDDNITVKITGQECEGRLLAGKKDNRVDDTNAEKVFNLIFDQYPTTVVKSQELKTALVDCVPAVMSEPTLFAALGKLIASGRLQKVSHGCYQVTPE